MIKPKAGISLGTLASFHALQKGEATRTFAGIGNIQVVRLPKGETVPNFIRKYEQSGLVEYAEPDYIVHLAAAAPNDPKYLDGTLWGLNNTGQFSGTVDADIDAPEGWEVLHSASNIVVAVIDTGVRYTHEDLAANMWVNPNDGSHGLCVVTNANTGMLDPKDPNDDYGHGTLVAGILGGVGNNGKGVTGVAWRVQIMACKFIDNLGNGTYSDAIACIDYARTNGAKIINASWGDYGFSMSLSNAIYSARNADIIFVAAAGNNATDVDISPYYPAGYDIDNIVSVAASTRYDSMAGFSNYGVTNVDLAAPGENICSTYFNSDSDYLDQFSVLAKGTSFAAPYVSGTFALMLVKYPTETPQQIISRLLAATDPLPAFTGKCVTGGRLNFQKAIGPPIRLTAVPTVSNGPFQLHLSGDPNRTYVIQVTTNFLSWTPVFTNITSTNGAFDFSDDQSTNSSSRIYRAVSAP
ncbi:MAG: S8 family serine peptidase [Verrucomicrobia bacterium]|nr:S8 family serine peptidase [Verrucomicrobiota bacterium]